MGSKDTLPADLLAVFENLETVEPKNGFTISITDDVTGHSIKASKALDVTPSGTKGCKFWGLGSDGTVGANKSAIKIIGIIPACMPRVTLTILRRAAASLFICVWQGTYPAAVFD